MNRVDCTDSGLVMPSGSGQPAKARVSVFWSEEDMAYVATCFDLPRLSGFGESPEDAVRELRVAIGLAVEVMIEDGEEIPASLTPPST